ncbi:hypothetical protein HOY80DRAFT_997662 [Tuber brumale]|nr:hypothetical protein HOY80DRAFT_997662 [Tuber brumale]
MTNDINSEPDFQDLSDKEAGLLDIVFETNSNLEDILHTGSLINDPAISKTPAVIHATTKDFEKQPYYHLDICDLLRMELAKPISANNIQKYGEVWGIFSGQHNEVQNDNIIRILYYYPLKSLSYRILEVHNESYSLSEKSHHLPATNLIAHYYPTNEYPPIPGTVTIVELDSCKDTSYKNYVPISLEYLKRLYPINSIRSTLMRVDSSLPIKVISISLWQDSLSGNRSKKWNSHECNLLSFPRLPVEFNRSHQEYRFVSIAKGSHGIKVLPSMICNIQQLHNGIIGYNAVNNQYALLTRSLLMITGDNPAASELANHSWKSNYPCRICLYVKQGTLSTNDDAKSQDI